MRQVVMEAFFYIVKGCIPWRYLPAGFPLWQTVYGIFRRWKRGHCRAALNDALRIFVCKTAGERSQPTEAVLDKQDLKSAGRGDSVVFDASKTIEGGKCHLRVDSLGLVLRVAVRPADATERNGANSILHRTLARLVWLCIPWVENSYSGPVFPNWAKSPRCTLPVKVVKRSDVIHGLKVLPRCWVVKRTFGWLLHHRRLARDYEQPISSAEAFAFVAMA